MKKIIFGLIFALIIVTSISLVSASDAADSGSENNTAILIFKEAHASEGESIYSGNANCTFKENYASNEGGAIYIEKTRASNITDTFTDNHALKDYGGKIWEEN